MKNKPIIIGIAGGTGSGKTSVANEIVKDLLKSNVEILLLEQDSYYVKLDHLTFEERIKLNYDHPDYIDFDLIIEHLDKLLNWESIEKPLYDFTIYNRIKEVEVVEPKKVIIIEGILIFSVEKLRKYFDMKIFVDTDDDVRLLRRIRRDMNERGRDFESINKQYLETVKPMHLEFVEPSKRYADIIIPRGKDNKVGIKMVSSRLKYLLKNQK